MRHERQRTYVGHISLGFNNTIVRNGNSREIRQSPGECSIACMYQSFARVIKVMYLFTFLKLAALYVQVVCTLFEIVYEACCYRKRLAVQRDKIERQRHTHGRIENSNHYIYSYIYVYI